MQSKKYYIAPAKVKKHIAVIGGGIGGMESAIVCAKRGHDVTLYEKSDVLGGVFIAAAAPSFKEKDRELIAWYNREIRKYPSIRIKLNTEITDISTIDADEIIVATGSTTRTLRVPGGETAIEAMDYLLDKHEVGENVVIIGGGLTGCEIAYDLYLQGKTPTIVEMKNDLIAADGICLANTSYLRDFFKTNNVAVYLESGVSEIAEGKVLVRNRDGEIIEVACDDVIVSIGYDSAPLVKNARHIHVVGDAHKIGNLRTVIWQAWDVAMKL